MHDLQYNGGKQVHTATGLIAACVHKSALSSSQPTGQSTMYLWNVLNRILFEQICRVCAISNFV